MFLEIFHHGAIIHASLRHYMHFRNCITRFEVLYVTLGFDVNISNLKKPEGGQKIGIALKCQDSDLFQWGAKLLGDAGYAVSMIDKPDSLPGECGRGRIRLAVLLQSTLNDEAVEWCKAYCAVNIGVPLVVISKRKDTVTELAILKAGADRYLSYPVIPELLAAHIETLVRRSITSRQAAFSSLRIDPISHCFCIGSSELQLAPVLFRLMDEFLSHPGEVLTFDVLLSAIQIQRKPLQRNVVKAYVHQLRKMLTPYGYHDVIKTLHRIGYRYDPPALH